MHVFVSNTVNASINHLLWTFALLVGTHASNRMRDKVAFHSWVEFLLIFNDVGGVGFPSQEWDIVDLEKKML